MSVTLDTLLARYEPSFPSVEWTLQPPSSMSNQQAQQLVERRNAIVGAMAELSRAFPGSLRDNTDYGYLLGSREGIDDQLIWLGATHLTSDGGPVDTSAWCAHEPPPAAAYFVALADQAHGWCCTSCRRITQIG